MISIQAPVVTAEMNRGSKMSIRLTLLRIKNRLMGVVAPNWVARRAARIFMTPRRFPIKEWEQRAERQCRRFRFGDGLSAAVWGCGGPRILLMHGWESRATQMYHLAQALVQKGLEVIAIDAPAHGHSGGGLANPVVFSEAILSAERQFGPFHGAIGHSMGAAALTIAMEAGVTFERCVLISSPANLHQVLTGFAVHIGFPGKCIDAFVHSVENAVGRPAKELNAGKILARIRPDVLLIHAPDDKEVPYDSMKMILRDCPGLRTHTAHSLGHRRIIHSPEIAAIVGRYMGRGLSRTDRMPGCKDYWSTEEAMVAAM